MSKLHALPLILPLGLVTLIAPSLVADESLTRRVNWRPQEEALVRRQLAPWLDGLRIVPARREAIDRLWELPSTSPAELVDRIVATCAVVNPSLGDFVLQGQSADPLEVAKLAATTVWDSGELPPLARSSLRLWLGKRLATHALYNEALDQLRELQPSEVVDPASLLFYRASAEFRLRQKDAGLETLAQLLSNPPHLPRRYATVAELMRESLRAFEADSLDDVARLMDTIRVRLDHGRAGKIVRGEEEEVVTKLEKMIDDLEKQRQQQQSSAGSPQGNRSARPAEKSQLPGGKAPGDIDRKQLGDDTEWGNLPPKEREESLQQLGEEFPAHYREVIEEYFRALAQGDP